MKEPMVHRPGERRMPPQEPPKQSNNSFQAAAIAVVSIVCLLMLSSPLWVAPLIRLTIPDRYIAAYFPEPLAEYAFNFGSTRGEGVALDTEVEDADEVLSDIATPTPTPTVTPPPVTQDAQSPATAVPTSTPSPVPTQSPLPDFVFLQNAQQYQSTKYRGQGWNNCGPTTLALNMRMWGYNTQQEDVKNLVKPDYEDSNVRPDELAYFAETQGMRATVRVNGDLDTLKELLAAGYPVMIERGFNDLPDVDWMGHYNLIVGYSETNQVFYMLDSYWVSHGSESVFEWDYNRFDNLWRHFNRLYLVVYEPGQEQEVADIIGEDWNDNTMYRNALQRAQQEAQTYNDTFSWWNLGSVLVALEDYENATRAFDQSRKRMNSEPLPVWRIYWYRFELFEAYYQTGRYEDLLALTSNLTHSSNYPESEEGHYYKGLAYLGQGRDQLAEASFQRALRWNPTYDAAQQALDNLRASN